MAVAFFSAIKTGFLLHMNSLFLLLLLSIIIILFIITIIIMIIVVMFTITTLIAILTLFMYNSHLSAPVLHFRLVMRYRPSKPYLYDMADNSMHRITQESQGKTRLYLPLKGRVLPVVG